MNLSALIHTFDKYSWLWPGLFESYKENWDQDVKLYLGTDIVPSGPLSSQFNTLLSGEGEWSDRLTNLLVQIPTEYLYYSQEDHWLFKNPPNLAELVDFMDKKQVLRLQISPINHYYTLQKGDNIRFFTPNSKYLVSHQPSIWRKDFLLFCLKSGENPWQNEYEGTKRLNKMNLINRIAIYNYDWYHHKCQRGSLIS